LEHFINSKPRGGFGFKHYDSEKNSDKKKNNLSHGIKEYKEVKNDS